MFFSKNKFLSKLKLHTTTYFDIDDLQKSLCEMTGGKKMKIKESSMKWTPHKLSFKYSNNKKNTKRSSDNKLEGFSAKFNEHGIGFDDKGHLIS